MAIAGGMAPGAFRGNGPTPVVGTGSGIRRYVAQAIMCVSGLMLTGALAGLLSFLRWYWDPGFQRL